MPTYKIDLPNGESYQIDSERELSDTEAFNAAMHTSQQGKAQAAPAPTSPLLKLGQGLLSQVTGQGRVPWSDIGSAAMNVGKQVLGTTAGEIGGGLRQMVAPKPEDLPFNLGQHLPGGLTDILGRTLGAGRVLGAPVTGLSQPGVEAVTQATGSPMLGTAAGLLGAFLAPEELTSAVPQALQQVGRFVTRPGLVPVRAAEATQAANIAANRAETAAYQEAQRAFAARQLQIQQAQELSRAAAIEQGSRISDKEQALVQAIQQAPNPTASEKAWAFMQSPQTSQIEIPVSKLPKALVGVQDQIAETPRAFRTPGVSKAERGATEAIDTITGPAGRVTSPEGVDLTNLSPLQQEMWAPILKDMEGVTSGGTIKMGQLQSVQQGLGKLTRSTDSRVSGVAKHLYKNLMDDLEEAAKTSPEAGQFLQATKITSQNLAAEDLADFMTNHGTRVKNGQILIQPDKLAQELRRTDRAFPLSKYLRPEALSDIQSALEDVFHVKTAPMLKAEDILGAPEKAFLGRRPVARKPLSEAFTPSRAEGVISRHPFITGGLLGSAMGLPHAIGIGLALAYPRAIFRLMTTPAGRSFARTLYATVPPVVNDTARYGAIVNFLRSRGDNIDMPPELAQALQQQAQQQAATRQQQQQAAMMQMLQQQQQQGGKQQ